VVIGINANVQDSVTEIAHYARIHKIAFPILKDVGNVVADRFGAERTPEVFVLDRSRTVRYWGAIDDQYHIGGIAKDRATTSYVAEALDALLAGKKVERPTVKSVGCHIGRVRTPDASSRVTYSNQIARIFQNRCVECHREGEIAPFALTDYSEVFGWAEMIEEVVREQRMPPWHANPKHGTFRNDVRLSDRERDLIDRWVKAGAPEGDRSELPKPRKYTPGWRIGEPDHVVYMSENRFVSGPPASCDTSISSSIRDSRKTSGFALRSAGREIGASCITSSCSSSRRADLRGTCRVRSSRNGSPPPHPERAR
jgi:mono/diheme cytochrome c family protein